MAGNEGIGGMPSFIFVEDGAINGNYKINDCAPNYFKE
jgi:hypothetical protein